MLGVRGTVGFEDRGSGAPLVLLHPFPFTRAVWSDIADTLGAGRRLIAIDARGFGESPLNGRYALADLADDLAALLDERGIARAAVLGMSMGGYTALAFAARHPDRLAALILADTRAAADGPEARAGRGKAIDAIQRDGADAYLDASLGRLLSPDAATHVRARARTLTETRAPSLIAGIEALRDRPDRSGELGAIRCPTLLVCGAGDQVTPAAEMRAVAAAIPNASFEIIAGAGHIAHLEAPRAVERAVTDFLKSASPGASQ
jgi:pimeloyl-ACP methyl ester carboxylesterase